MFSVSGTVNGLHLSLTLKSRLTYTINSDSAIGKSLFARVAKFICECNSIQCVVADYHNYPTALREATIVGEKDLVIFDNADLHLDEIKQFVQTTTANVLIIGRSTSFFKQLGAKVLQLDFSYNNLVVGEK